MINPHIFRAYDIRGKAHTELSSDACEAVGRGFGTVLRIEMKIDAPRVLVGRDARTHGPELEAALIKGLVSTGCHVFKIGQTPSPLNYFTLCQGGYDASVQVTASHNPAEDNGLKLQLKHAEAYAGEKLQELRERIERDDFIEGTGSEETIDAVDPYIDHLTELFTDAGKGMTIAVDGGNGVAGPVYCDVLKKVGATIHELYIEPDGNFPNHAADPSKHETLQELQAEVQKTGSALGFAFDGDGDRVGIVDEQGDILTADQILLLLAHDHLSRNPGKPVIFTVSGSSVLQTEIKKWGGKPVMCKVGHSFVEHAMREHGALLGGEQSGHFFCGEGYFGFDDALVAALHVLSIVQREQKPLSELIAAFPKVYQMPELRPHCPDDKKGQIIQEIITHFKKSYPVDTMDGARIDFGDNAWAGIRQSNTSPKLSICIEAQSPEKLAAVQEEVLSVLRTHPEIDLKTA